MKILITGTSSGIGQGVMQQLLHHDITALSRADLDLSDVSSVAAYSVDHYDMLINCAATGVGGKIDLVNHSDTDTISILNVNLISPILLSKKVLKSNPQCRIVNITSTNNNHYYPTDLIYSLSKLALADFGRMLKIEYPGTNLLEIKLGLTKTNFNHNRYSNNLDRYYDIYQHPHLTVEQAVTRIMVVLFDSSVKSIEISV
jgi:3-oxoacyl-[acyl-carrier protein] reductase